MYYVYTYKNNGEINKARLQCFTKKIKKILPFLSTIYLKCQLEMFTLIFTHAFLFYYLNQRKKKVSLSLILLSGKRKIVIGNFAGHTRTFQTSYSKALLISFTSSVFLLSLYHFLFSLTLRKYSIFYLERLYAC